MSSSPVVSVLMITYNHERFIRQAVESVLSQETDFEFELVIGEDVSTDATTAIVREYAEAHPDKIRLVLAERNRGWLQNVNDTLAHCRGEFIALLEGDDYWVSTSKLQKQVNLLREHQDHALCFTRVEKIHKDGSSSSMPAFEVAKSTGIREIVARQFVQTCSVMMRRSAFQGMPPGSRA